MNTINKIFTLTSLTVLLVTIERFSFTTKILLQPYNFLRLHEVIQMLVIINLTIILPFFVLKSVTDNFERLKSKKGTMLGVIFIMGIYLYATGNGVHELASYQFNTFCTSSSSLLEEGIKGRGSLCSSMFFNDYYFGNIVYFAGAFLFTVAIMVLERMKPNKTFTKKEMSILLTNSVIFALTIFAYSAFDRVLVGLVYSIITAIVACILLLTAKRKFQSLPYTMYTVTAFVLGVIASIIVRFH